MQKSKANRDWADNGARLAKLAKKSTWQFLSQHITIFHGSDQN